MLWVEFSYILHSLRHTLTTHCVVWLCRAPSSEWEVWFSVGWGTKEVENVFLRHGWESGYRWGVSGHMACVRVLVWFCHMKLPDMPHPPTCEVLVECVMLRWNYSLATFCVIVRQLCSYVNKGQAVWFSLAWFPAMCDKIPWAKSMLWLWHHFWNFPPLCFTAFILKCCRYYN